MDLNCCCYCAKSCNTLQTGIYIYYVGVLKLTCATKPIEHPLSGCRIKVDQLPKEDNWLLGSID